MAKAVPRRPVLPRERVLPWWIALLVFVPLEIWLFLEMRAAWGVWRTLGVVLVLALLAARAARPKGILAWIFPRWRERRHAARPVWLLALVAAAAASWFLPWGPQPWLPAFAAVLGAKAVVA